MGFKTYKLDFGWEVVVQESWIMERKEQGSFIFYPDDPEDETTMYASALHSEDHKTLAPARLMESAFDKSVPPNAEMMTIPTRLSCKAFSLVGSDGTYRIGAGFYTDGDLLSLNVYAKSEEKAKAAAAGFSRTKYAGGGKDAF
ncbi:MAG: hypothetical protein NC299_04560 [Lachnospiraceae bacterium]|nr:hypothetical protein [Ruminococcus sp.]MCM1274621.1 hypothetical protein [Lachnospiraceae bacterium]